jgi:DNA-binding transcriptional ArsR family regulator
MEQQSVQGLSGFGGLSVDAALDALGDERRRAVVRVLHGTEEPVPVQELATEISRLPDTAVRDRDRVVVDLHHRTLPKLDALGVVDYDPENTVVEPRAAVGDLLGLVEYVEYTSG